MTKKLTFRNIISWYDRYVLKYLTAFLIVFIPVYPKLPAITLRDTFIHIRLDDFVVVAVIGLYLLQVLRRKIRFDKRLAMLFLAFWGAVLLAFGIGFLIAKKGEPLDVFPYLGALHSARRVEYMMLFWVALSSVYSKKDFTDLIKISFGTFIFVSIYGFCQKYTDLFEPIRQLLRDIGNMPWGMAEVVKPVLDFFYFPAVQTMNPVFSQGKILTLVYEARVSSTFAGHYDLAAYLVFLLPIFIGYFLVRPNWKIYLGFATGILALVLTSSRISVGSYAMSVFAMVAYLRKIKLGIIILITSVALSALVGGGIFKRFADTVRVQRIYLTAEDKIVDPSKTDPNKLPIGNLFKQLDEQNLTPEELEKLRADLLKKYREDALKYENRQLTDAEVEALATLSASTTTVVGLDTSTTTRFQVEWPRAWNAFFKNPITGTGPYSITESTDGDYFRWLGEMGLLGTGTFLFLLYTIGKAIFVFARKMQSRERYIHYGFLFGLLGLLINATFIDVFEASKVAYTFWLTAGVFMARTFVNEEETI